MAYHTSHYIAHVKFRVSGKVLLLVIICETHDGTMDLQCFPWQPPSAQCLQDLDTLSTCFFVFLKAMCLQFVSFCPIVVQVFCR